MKNPGILWMLQVGLGLSLAGPMFVAGAIFVTSGRYLFGGFVFVCGLAALFAPNLLLRRVGGPRSWIGRLTGGPRSWIRRRTPGRPDDPSAESREDGSGVESAEDGSTADGSTEASGVGGVLTRLRNR
ncbi:hypothetical protein [Natronosalvus halobius]|uniref:hypothetical protein n=1 Tax=Natronosalvus halobius TaxID=2953746 RepID=UPI0020A1FF8B|nr:hypothetical protein [Natronosalvus halobius]USZ70768.1 hypothetical protein NGM15_11725 [Natronosalvus halobius]